MAYTLDPEQHEVRALEAVIDFSGKDVLEPGCGDGRMTLRYAARATSVLGLDRDAATVARARERATAVGALNVAFRVGDLFTAELPSASFDVVLFSGTL